MKKINIEDEEKQKREIEVHRKLNHKYVVTLIEYEIKVDQIVLLIEFAKFGDLFSFIRKSKLNMRKILKFYYKII